MIHRAVGCTDQGVPYEHVIVEPGDSAGPHGGGAWASRGLSIATAKPAPRRC